ncbi:hypothetical protein HYX00_04580 [Candidatus Woesearchaeota archaeon]|nr:hypothetical protein [Candidatus Woesearchaeota archaeon]
MVIKNIKKYQNPNPNGRFLIDCPGCKKRKEYHAKGYCYRCYKTFSWKSKDIKCKSCGRTRPHKAFGLCAGCHVRLHHYDLTKSYNAKKSHSISLEKLRELTKSCVSCDFDKLITLHHLDGNRQNNGDGNLIGLCPNCHKMIHTYQYYEEVKDVLKQKGYNTEKVHPTNYVKR